MKLTEAKLKQRVKILNLHFPKEDQNRLFYLGLYQGAIIEKIAYAPLYDPCLYRIQDNIYCLRNKDASNVEVEGM